MNRTRLVQGLLAVLAAQTVGCDSGSTPAHDATPQDLTSVLELEPYVGRLVTVTGQLHGDSLRLLFDSGGGETLLAPRVAEQIPCAPAGRAVGMRMSGERVEWPLCHDVTLGLAGRDFVDGTVGIWDLMEVLPDGLPRLDGLISLETFRDRLVTLNLGDSRLVVETPDTFADRVRRMTRVPMRIATGNNGGHLVVFLQGRLSGAESSVWLLLDSANLAETLLAPHVRDQEAASEVTIVFADSVTVTAPARTADIIYDGALSEAFIRQIIVSLDLARGEAWIATAS